MTMPQKFSPNEQRELDSCLYDATKRGDTEAVQRLLVAGADVHVVDDWALCWAAWIGYTETVRILLANGADVHAQDDQALREAANHGRTETVKVLAGHIFAPDLWRGKSRVEIEGQAAALYDKIEAENLQPKHLRQAGMILLDCALRCWEQVRPPPPKIKISPFPAQPRPL